MKSSNVVTHTQYYDSESLLQQHSMDENNSTNDITIAVNKDIPGTIQSIRLASLELPLSQNKIEPLWNTFYFDEGFSVAIKQPFDIHLLEFPVHVNGELFPCALLPYLNPIVTVQSNNNDSRNFTLTTLYPHGLRYRHFYEFDQTHPIVIVGTPLISPDHDSIRRLTHDNPHLHIIDDYSFRLTWQAPLPDVDRDQFVFADAPVSIRGYLHTPKIPTPHHMAQVITSIWSLTQVPLRLEYQATENKFWIVNATTATVTVAMNQPYSLWNLLGFGSQNITFTSRLHEAISTYAFHYSLSIDVGNYLSSFGRFSPEKLVQHLCLQLNRFYFPPNAYIVMKFPVQKFRNRMSCHEIPLPSGICTPEQICKKIHEFVLYGAINGSTFQNDFQVKFVQNEEGAYFTFENYKPFEIHFEDSTPGVAELLGFFPVAYLGLTQYHSTQKIFYPQKRTESMYSALGWPFLNYLYKPNYNSTQSKLGIQVSKPGPYRGNFVGPNSPGPFTGYTGPSPCTFLFTEGLFQANQVVYIKSGDKTYSSVVQHVFYSSARQICCVYPLYHVIISGGNDTSDYCYLSDTVCSNIYGTTNNPVLNTTLGLNNQVYSYFSTTVFWEGSSQMNLFWPNYLLVELVDLPISQQQQHTHDSSTKSHIIAKCVFKPEYQMTMILPNWVSCTGLEKLDRVRIRILNPDHSLYQLHNKSWNFSLTFKILSPYLELMCA